MMINLQAKVVKKHQSRNKKLSSSAKNVFLGTIINPIMDFTFQHIETVDSTNAFLQRLQGTSEINGFVVSADEQTAGKGMGSNSWESAKGLNLTFSVAFDMSWLLAAEQFLLSQLVPLGILEVLDNYLPKEQLKIKWPNDIYYDGHKLGGILINNTISGNFLDKSIVGIGLNVNQMEFTDWPTLPISMKMIMGKDYDLKSLMGEIVRHIGNLIEEVRGLSLNRIQIRNSINDKYYARLYRYHEWADYETRGQILKLFMSGIDPFGRLQLIDDIQHQHTYDIKEIRFVI